MFEKEVDTCYGASTSGLAGILYCDNWVSLPQVGPWRKNRGESHNL